MPRWGPSSDDREGIQLSGLCVVGCALKFAFMQSYRFCSNDMLYPPLAGSLFILNMSVDRPKGLSMPFPSCVGSISEVRER